MKKLMIGMFGALAMVAGATDIESTNVVGFEDRGLAKNTKVVTGANFVTVGENGLNLQSIKMDASVEDGGAMIWWWNTETGTYDEKANWFTCLYDADGNELNISGWGDGADWIAIQKTFTVGESFWIQVNKTAEVTVAGEVTSVDSNLEYCGIDLLKNTKVQLSNPFPSAIDLQAIKMDETVEDGGAMIWWWNSEKGMYDEKANWFTCLYDADGNELNISGWGDGADWIAIEKTFASGEGFWIQANKNASVKFPNPFFKE